MNYKLYEVGGAVRDEILGITSNDIDYTFVPEKVSLLKDIEDVGGHVELVDQIANPIEVFNSFVSAIKEEGFEVFLETPECFTVRAKFPENYLHSGVADFVMARKETYEPSSRKPKVVLGTLEDDLRRRDFTVNAIAKDVDDNYIDPFNGRQDIRDRVLRTPVDAQVSINDDPLRILRAFRFSVTKSFGISEHLYFAIQNYSDYDRLRTISSERVRDELYKMFNHNTLQSWDALNALCILNRKIWEFLFKDIWLKPTLEKP